MSRKILLLSSSFVCRASLAALLGAGCLVGTAAATPEDTFPQAPTRADILRWLTGNSDLNPESVVTMTDELVVAVTARQDGRGVGRSTRLTLREEVINPDAAAAWGGRSIELDLDLDCARHRAILGTRRIYARTNLQGPARITRSDNAWTEVPPDTVVDDVARAVCSPQPPTQLAEAPLVPRRSDSATVAGAAAVPPTQIASAQTAPAQTAPPQAASAEPPPAASAPAPGTERAYAAQVPVAETPAAPPAKVAEAEAAPAPAPPASQPAPPAPRPVQVAEAAPAPEPPPEPVRVASPAPAPEPVHVASPASAAPPPEISPAQPVKVAAADPPPAPPAVTIVTAPAGAVTVVPTEPAAPPQVEAPQPQLVHNPFAVAEADKPPGAPPSKSPPPAVKPAPRPASAVGPAPRPLDFAVQIAAAASADLARDSWQALKAKLPSLVEPLTFAVEPVDANGRTLYRALLLGFATPDDAAALCKTLRSQSVDCILRQMK